jgi:hypothetical protein
MSELVTCLGCKKQISKESTACVGCGKPISGLEKVKVKGTGFGTAAFIMSMIALILPWLGWSFFLLGLIFCLVSFGRVEKSGLNIAASIIMLAKLFLTVFISFY